MKLKETYQLSDSFDLDEYDKHMRKQPPEHKLMISFISKKYKSNKNIKLIEFGAGTGRFTKFFLKRFSKANLTLVEPDKKCCLKLNKLKQKHKQIKIIQSSGENFRSHSKFDIIIMSTAFHHIPFEGKLRFLKIVKGLMNKNSTFLCTDNFLDEYKTMNEREIILKKIINKWIKDARKDKDKAGLKIALEMKSLVFRKDFGGEYFICGSKFESYVKKAGLKIKEKIDVTEDPLDIKIYLYILIK